jgi:hypothetical protein
LIEENPHSGGALGASVNTVDCEFNYRFDMFSVQSFVPLHDVIEACPGFEVSKIAATGIRVPFKTHAPLNLPGMLSTAAHSDQSRAAITPPHLSRFACYACQLQISRTACHTILRVSLTSRDPRRSDRARVLFMVQSLFESERPQTSQERSCITLNAAP